MTLGTSEHYTMELTHKGWFGFCPVKIGGLDTDAPLIVPRWWWLAPVFWLAEQHEALVIGLRSIFMPDAPAVWAIKETDRLASPETVPNMSSDGEPE